MHLPGFEPGTFRVWGERDNHYTTSATLLALVLYLLSTLIQSHFDNAIRSLAQQHVSTFFIYDKETNQEGWIRPQNLPIFLGWTYVFMCQQRFNLFEVLGNICDCWNGLETYSHNFTCLLCPKRTDRNKKKSGLALGCWQLRTAVVSVCIFISS